jgi:YidC/Oxa1 family membrane protein insertase
MDKNQAIGLALIFVLLTVYFQFFVPPPEAAQNTNNKQTSQQTTTQEPQQPVDTSQKDTTALVLTTDSAKQAQAESALGAFARFAEGKEKQILLRNEHLSLVLSSKGGKIAQVTLLDHLDQNKKHIQLLDPRNNQMALLVQTKTGKSIDLYSLYFETSAAAEVVVTKDSATVVFSLTLGNGQAIEQVYTLKPDAYTVDYHLRFKGLDNVLKPQPAELQWAAQLRNTEPDITQTRNQTTVNYYTATGSFDYLSESAMDAKEAKPEQALHWIAFKQKFFSSALIDYRKELQQAKLNQVGDADNTEILKTVSASIQLPWETLSKDGGRYAFFFGPNRYYVLRDVSDGFYKNVNLGWPIINIISRFVIVPLFAFLEGVIGNYGLIIIVLVFLIRLVLLPLSYRSYISMAKMRVIKPELDALKERVGDDMQAMQQEQMKLYQQVGINPLSGCVPVLLQIPVLFAMFTFFPNAIELRQQGFLWASDLSVYDSILTLPFAIPFYGDHVSLFTILMTVSTLLVTLFNAENSPSVDGPMKSVQYVMPVMFLFILNSFPAGLSFYYLVSNLFSIGQQFIIRRFVDDEKIKLILEENRKKNKNKKKSGFQERLEAAMKAQENMKGNKKGK